MRQILVFGTKTFKISVPDDAKLTFGPFSPPQSRNAKASPTEPWSQQDRAGTLRVYDGLTKNPLAVFSGVNGFRDLSIEYAEEVAKEEGATIWKSDRDGYQREERATRQREWMDPAKQIGGSAVPLSQVGMDRGKGKK